jgi:hypothetical protein
VDARTGLLIRYGGDFVDGVVARASGSFVETVDGQRVLDFTAGQIYATVGHNHPRVVAAIEAACREMLHLNSWMLSEPVLALADPLGRDAARASAPGDVAVDRRRGDRGRVAHGQALRRAMRRLNLVLAKTGSMVTWRLP